MTRKYLSHAIGILVMFHGYRMTQTLLEWQTLAERYSWFCFAWLSMAPPCLDMRGRAREGIEADGRVRHFSGFQRCNLSGGVALIVWFTTNGMCVKNNTIMYVARTSKNRMISSGDLYCCLLSRCEALRTCRSGFPIATKWCYDQDVTVVRNAALTQRTCDRCGSL